MMIELAPKDYHKALDLVRQIQINTMFAEAVLEQQITGHVYVDCIENPCTFYVVHSYGMSLLFGDAGIESFTNKLYDYITNQSATREQVEWLQADPGGEWSGIVDGMLSFHNSELKKCDLPSGGFEEKRIMRNTRVNFTFDHDAYQQAKQKFPRHSEPVIRITPKQFLTQTGAVIPRHFWRDEEHFATEGVGYALLRDGETASSAFSSCRTGNQLEIGIETAEAYRGNGYAVSVCSALIEYCLDHDLEPVWACRLENEGSYYLAQKLGFRPSVTLPYYRLPV
ncbi:MULTISPECIES: GNAT family N-acetyltransferase [unclassified Paenibacillus]|uniref:GNAT family N-acetyltransferase n=1 Tax=unclassified Paenibacillus TaxID=185978 RepID=UPI0030F6E992